MDKRVRCEGCGTVFTTRGGQRVCGACALEKLMGGAK